MTKRRILTAGDSSQLISELHICDDQYLISCCTDNGSAVPVLKDNDLWFIDELFAIQLNYALFYEGKIPVSFPGSGMYELLTSEDFRTARSLLRREIEVVSVAELKVNPKEGYYGSFDPGLRLVYPFRWRGAEEAIKDAMHQHLEDEELLLYSGEEYQYARRYRVWFNSGEVQTSCMWDNYDLRNYIFPDKLAGSENEMERVNSYAQVFVDFLSRAGMTHGVFDVGMVHGGTLQVIEMVPVWSSSWHDGALHKICQTLEKTFDDMEMTYLPSPTLTAKACSYPLIKVS